MDGVVVGLEWDSCLALARADGADARVIAMLLFPGEAGMLAGLAKTRTDDRGGE